VFSEYRKISSLIERIQNCFGSKEGTFNEIVCTFPASPSLSRDQGDRLSMLVEVALHGPGKRKRNHDGAASQENIYCRNPGNTDQTYGVFDAPRSNHRIDPAQYYCQQGLKSITPGPNDDTIAMRGSEGVSYQSYDLDNNVVLTRSAGPFSMATSVGLKECGLKELKEWGLKECLMIES